MFVGALLQFNVGCGRWYYTVSIINNDQYREMKKYAFLYIGDEKEANLVVDKTVRQWAKKYKELPDKEAIRYLRDELIYQCRLYTKKISYQKDSFLKFLGIKWYGAPFSGWRSINKLSTAIREVMLGLYIFNMTHAEIARSFHLPPGHVTAYIDRAKKRLNILNEKDEEKFIHSLMVDLQFIDGEKANENFPDFAPLPTRSLKTRLIGGGIGIIVIFGLMGLFFLFGKDESKDASEQTEFQESVPEDSPSQVIVPTEILELEIKDLYYELMVHDNFYNQPYFLSSKEARKYAAEEMHRMIETRKFANERNVFLDEKKLEELKSIAMGILDYRKTVFSEEKYLQRVLDEFQITEEQYIDYLLLEEEYNFYYMKLYDLEVNIEPLYDLFWDSKLLEPHYNKVGITLEEALEINEQDANYHYVEVEERQFDLPFDLTGSYMQIVQNANGEYVLENPKTFGLAETKYENFINSYTPNRFTFHITRTILDDYIDWLDNYNTSSEETAQLARELVEIYKLLKNSIEREL